MKKFLLLAGLLLGLSTFAVANSIDYDTGIFKSGTLSGSFSTSINVNIIGSLNTIDLITGTLIRTTSGCPPDSACFDFTGGSVKVSNSSGTLFFDTLSGGLTIRENGSASIDAVLMPNSSVNTGAATATFNFSAGKITSGSEDVSFSSRGGVVPEPSSLLLLGSGLVPLAAWRLKKLAR